MARVRIVALWIVQILLAVMMIGPGMSKFTGPNWERMFRVWGYPDHFYLVIGAIEVVGGIGLLVPRIASASALVLAVVMVGAAITQRTVGGRNGVGELVFASLLLLLAYARWPGILGRLNTRRRPAVSAA